MTPLVTYGQALELSVTPTLFEMSAIPEQSWKSQIKVINSNKHPLTVYAEVRNFAPRGELGEGKFIPVYESFTEGSTLAEWVTITHEAIVIPPETSQTIPFTVQVPKDASPGGHFAAIMIGTRPPEKKERLQLSTSQVVTSLFFVRVAGDVVEEGFIRDFTTEKRFVDSPKATFSLRFENKGNVHIQPQGSIEITNMWGKERGVIPINHQTHFGNVLPNSIRKFEFTWKGESTITDIGRYKAVVTLGYGVDERKFQTSTTYFYVVPVKPLLMVLGSALFIIFFISWCIRTYVRRMLALSGVDVHAYEGTSETRKTFVREGDVLIQKRASVKAPLMSGMFDLRGRLARTTAFGDTVRALFGFVVQYKLFFGSLLVLVLIGAVLFNFAREVGKENKDYEVVIENPDQDVTLTSEEIIYERANQEDSQPEKISNETVIASSTDEGQPYELTVINAGDTPGAAAALKKELIREGYEVAHIGSDYGPVKKKTVIVYTVGLEALALDLSKRLDGALLSASPEEDDGLLRVTIFIGNDYDFTE